MPKLKNDHKKSRGSQKKGPSGESAWVDTDRVVNRAQHIVSSAVNVLEEEIAAGILAAKKIEKRLIDVEEIRSDPDDLMNRIRRDSHEALDLFIDAFASITGKLNTLLEALKKDPEENGPPEKQHATAMRGGIILLEAEAPLRPGKSASLTLSLLEDGPETGNRIALEKSDLSASSGRKIHSRAITISPRVVTLLPEVAKEVTITVRIPKSASPGHYNALLTDRLNPHIKVILSVNVIE